MAAQPCYTPWCVSTSPCRQPKCPQREPPSADEPELCKYLAFGGCVRGADCPFSHSLVIQPGSGLDSNRGFVLGPRVHNAGKATPPAESCSTQQPADRSRNGTPTEARASTALQDTFTISFPLIENTEAATLGTQGGNAAVEPDGWNRARDPCYDPTTDDARPSDRDYGRHSYEKFWVHQKSPTSFAQLTQANFVKDFKAFQQQEHEAAPCVSTRRMPQRTQSALFVADEKTQRGCAVSSAAEQPAAGCFSCAHEREALLVGPDPFQVTLADLSNQILSQPPTERRRANQNPPPLPSSQPHRLSAEQHRRMRNGPVSAQTSAWSKAPLAQGLEGA